MAISHVVNITLILANYPQNSLFITMCYVLNFSISLSHGMEKNMDVI